VAFGGARYPTAAYSFPGVNEMFKKRCAVKPLSNGVLWVEMDNGACGEFDVKPYMNLEFFSKLKNPAYFQQANSYHNAQSAHFIFCASLLQKED